MVGLAVLALAGPAWAQIRYVDDRGEVWYVTTWEQVPDQYLDRATASDLLPQKPQKASSRPTPRDLYLRQQAAETQRLFDRQDREMARRAWETAVRDCRDGVQREYDSFDAFVPAPGSVHFIGPKQANFAFEKCMAEAGQSFKVAR